MFRPGLAGHFWRCLFNANKSVPLRFTWLEHVWYTWCSLSSIAMHHHSSRDQMTPKRISDLDHIDLTSAKVSSLSPLETRSNDPPETPIYYVRLTWVDFSNKTHCRIVSLPAFVNLLKKDPPAIRIPKITFGDIFGRVAQGFDGVGNWLLVIDHNSVRWCPYETNTVNVFGWFREIQAIGTVPALRTRVAAPLCPRYILHRVLQSVPMSIVRRVRILTI